jgi:histidine ammonia-lyase
MMALRIGDEPLTPSAVAAAARADRLDATLGDAARERMAAAHRAAVEIAARRPVYGWTTGVGANRHVEVGDDPAAHALRLLRSHAAGVGEPLPAEVVRATVLVRAAQMAAGGGGSRPEVADALLGLLARDTLPEVRDGGGIGTGDLTVLAQLGLAVQDAIGPGDALPLMSSNAATFAVAALAWADLRELLEAGLAVAAQTFAALEGNREAFAPALAAGRPLPGTAEVAARLWELTDGAAPPARIQDPFGLRTLPQVGGALHAALAGLHDVLAVEIVAASENPLFADGDALHHGGFHAASCALALDAVRLALVPFATLSGARLSALMDPELTGLAPFLATGAPGSSGLMIAEYAAQDAIARLRADAAPAVLGGVSISRGLEEHASFAWQGAGQARRAAGRLRTVLALEWLTAERALRMRAGEAVPEDQAIGDDAARAEAALGDLARRLRRPDH